MNIVVLLSYVQCSLLSVLELHHKTLLFCNQRLEAIRSSLITLHMATALSPHQAEKLICQPARSLLQQNRLARQEHYSLCKSCILPSIPQEQYNWMPAQHHSICQTSLTIWQALHMTRKGGRTDHSEMLKRSCGFSFIIIGFLLYLSNRWCDFFCVIQHWEATDYAFHRISNLKVGVRVFKTQTF